MNTIIKIEAQISTLDLFQAIEQLSQSELDQFIEKVLQFKAQKVASSLKKDESELLIKINQSLPQDLEELYLTLIEKRDQETLTNAEYHKLLALTETVEKHEVQRLEYLIQLANIRQISLADLITQMGLKPISNDR